ncbi:MAG: TPM domain-containing protein [Treponema sp.]
MVEKVKKTNILLILILCPLYFPVSAQTRGQTIVDHVGVLSPKDVQTLSTKLDAFSRSTQMDSVVVLVKNTGDKTAESYADDYFDYHGYGFGDTHEGVLLLIVTGDGSKGSRHIHISTCGVKTIEKITDSAIDSLIDAAIQGGLRENNYQHGILSYIELLSELYTNQLSSFELLVSLFAGLGLFIAVYWFIRNRYRIKKLPPQYNTQENTEAAFQSVEDTLIKSHTSRIKRPKEKINSSASSTHTSSSGRSHGGGGRSY